MSIDEKVDEVQDLCKILCDVTTMIDAKDAQFSHLKRLSYIICDKTRELHKLIYSGIKS